MKRAINTYWILVCVGGWLALLIGCSENPNGRPGQGGSDGTSDGGRSTDTYFAPSKECTPENCNGCCQGFRCVRGFSQTVCGKAGAACTDCGSELSCIGGECKAGSKEICNGVDDDGDFDADEGCDGDHDLFCRAGMDVDEEKASCRLSSDGRGDCDDSRPEVNPDADEICNGMDDDCDGKTDEDDVCKDQGVVSSWATSLPAVLGNHACAQDSSTNKIFCFGGTADTIYESDQILEFDPGAAPQNTPVPMTATLPTARTGLACVEDSSTHKIYCFGGYWQETECIKREPYGCVEAVTKAINYLDGIFAYDPKNNTVETRKAKLPSGRLDLSCVERSDTHKIYCFGGNAYGPKPLDQILEYDPKADRIVTKTATLPAAVADLSCAEHPATHQLYCFGGKSEFVSPSKGNHDTVVAYDTATDSLTTKTAKLPEARSALACAANSSTNIIYCFGGIGSKMIDPTLKEIIAYHPTEDRVTVLDETLRKGNHSLACAEESGAHRLFCFGGSANTVRFDDVVQFKP